VEVRSVRVVVVCDSPSAPKARPGGVAVLLKETSLWSGWDQREIRIRGCEWLAGIPAHMDPSEPCRAGVCDVSQVCPVTFVRRKK
jgi:hypothetical protein